MMNNHRVLTNHSRKIRSNFCQANPALKGLSCKLLGRWCNHQKMPFLWFERNLYQFPIVKKRQVNRSPKVPTWSIQIQKKEVVSNPKQSSCTKRCSLLKAYGENRYEIQVGGQEMAVMVGKWEKL